jgi:hypothetical protein
MPDNLGSRVFVALAKWMKGGKTPPQTRSAVYLGARKELSESYTRVRPINREVKATFPHYALYHRRSPRRPLAPWI